MTEARAPPRWIRRSDSISCLGRWRNTLSKPSLLFGRSRAGRARAVADCRVRRRPARRGDDARRDRTAVSTYRCHDARRRRRRPVRMAALPSPPAVAGGVCLGPAHSQFPSRDAGRAAGVPARRRCADRCVDVAAAPSDRPDADGDRLGDRTGLLARAERSRRTPPCSSWSCSARPSSARSQWRPIARRSTCGWCPSRRRCRWCCSGTAATPTSSWRLSPSPGWPSTCAWRSRRTTSSAAPCGPSARTPPWSSACTSRWS